MNKLRWSIICVVVSALLAVGTSYWHSASIERLGRSGLERYFEFIRSISSLFMSSAAIIYFIGLAFMIAHIKGLPRSKRALPCILLVVPAAMLTFMALMVGMPRQSAGGGYITYAMIYGLYAGAIVGVFFLLWSLISLGPDKRPCPVPSVAPQ